MKRSIGPRVIHYHWPARDGFRLAVTVYEPATDATETVIISGAVAVRRLYYDCFARYLSDNGFRVVTFDYRGIGNSAPTDIRGLEAGMRDWAENDLAGIIDETTWRHPASRLQVVGHSAGGQFLGLADNNHSISGMLAIGCQNGYWRFWPWPFGYLLAFLWIIFMPCVTRACGYFPARRLGLGEDLPAGIAMEWARWCRNSKFIVDADGQPIRRHFDTFAGEICAYSIADDWMAPRGAVDALMALFSRARIERRHVRPKDIGLRTVGHFGFFREQCRETLWARSLHWLRGDERRRTQTGAEGRPEQCL